MIRKLKCWLGWHEWDNDITSRIMSKYHSLTSRYESLGWKDTIQCKRCKKIKIVKP